MSFARPEPDPVIIYRAIIDRVASAQSLFTSASLWSMRHAMRMRYSGLLAATSIIIVAAAAACGADGGSGDIGNGDAGSSSGDGSTPNGAVIGKDGGSAADGSTADSSVVVANLSYVNGTDTTTVSFILRNEASSAVSEIRRVKVSFDGTEVTSFEAPACSEWLVTPGSASPILKIQIATFDTDDSNNTTFITCSGKLVQGDMHGGSRPRSTIASIGKGTVTVQVSGLFVDAAPFVANADASAP